MRLASVFLLFSVSLACGLGCQNASGERLTLGEWWGGGDAALQEEASLATTDDRAGEDTGGTPVPQESVAAVAADGGSGDTLITKSVQAPPARAQGRQSSHAVQQVSLSSAEDFQPGGSPSPVPTSSPNPSPQAIHADALMVNDETVTVDDILEPLLPRIEKLAAELPARSYYQRVSELVRSQIIEVVAQRLIWQRAKEEIGEDAEPRLDKYVERAEKDRINREFNGSETRYTRYLAKQGKTRAEVRELLRRSIIVDSYLRDNLLPLVPRLRKKELLQQYQAHIEDFSTPAQREMFLVDVPVNAFLGRGPVADGRLERAGEEARRTIQDAAEALQAGDMFEDVARKYSHGVNKGKGGAWGFIRGPLRGRWAEPSERLFQMRPGEVSDVIEAADSYFIVKVGRVEESKVVSFQEAQPRIADGLRQHRFAKLRSEFLQKELEQSTIGELEAFVDEVLKSIPPSQQDS